MSIGLAYIIFIFVLGALAIYNFSYLASYEPNINKLKFRSKSRIIKLMQDLNKEEANNMRNLFDAYSLNISPKQYRIVRTTILSVFGFLWFINLLLFGKNSIWGPLVIIGYLASSPREKILGIDSPLKHFLVFHSKRMQKKRDIELYNIISQIKNIYMTLDDFIGTDYVLEQVLKFSKYTRRMFIKFISLWNLNQKELAIESFVTSSGSVIGRDLAHLIGKLDSLSKKEIIEQLEVYQNNAREVKETYRAKSQEIKSTLYYGLSVFLIILIILNMLITIIFSDLIQQFKQIM